MSSAAFAQTAQPAAAAAGTTTAKGAPPPIADFFRDPLMRRPKISPDGRAVALVVSSSEHERSALAVIELDQGNRITQVASFTDSDIAFYAWVGNGRLVYTSGKDEAGKRRDYNAAGLWTVKRDGSERRQLIMTRYAQAQTESRVISRGLPYDWFLYDVPDDDSGEVIVGYGRYDARWDLKSVQLARLNVETQQRRMLETKSPDKAVNWEMDAAGEPWALQTLDENREALYFKTADGTWQLAQEGDWVHSPTARPFASDGRDLRLVIDKSAAGTQALYRVDPRTLKKEAEPLVSLAGFDFYGVPVFDTESRRLLGLHFVSDAPTTHWFDPTLKVMQATVDQALPGRVNTLSCQRCLKSGRVMVTSQADTQPSEYFLYDHAAKQLRAFGSARPWIRAADMAQVEQTRIRARDGLEFPVTVTTPAGKVEGPRPAVVLVHGGPFARGTTWGWNSLPQFLASRGYVVIEPEFRGSDGYGEPLFKAGWRQWGEGMIDDLSDSLAWAVKQGWVDAKRVCIAGASYGGYAAMMGLIKDPGQYRCGVSWAGVTDLDYLFSLDWSDESEAGKRYGLPALVGDRVKDAEMLRRTSPLRRAADLKAPVLIAHGYDDHRVPIDHASDFRRALEKSGHKDVEYVAYEGEGHGWRKLSTDVDFYGRMERFLAKHLVAPTSGAH
ncbi:alpha/beta fold hydrolase [Mitsuaria sp. 7]|uniref:S9 family peptidase n=1 Tax=Mitsuaria sp. 7 TaxID=1658665 RepID=UPI0007DDE1B9|nr:alpha/beta fold hydrolase [Mitsuaria sp. 7]ANH70379.1 hypothetical protein ABE85_08765 [Mitsuaria sp. 7]